MAASKTILLAEDEAALRMIMSETLLDAGYEVVEAENAVVAFAELEARAGGVAVLITDDAMPGGPSGLELAAIVHQRWPDIGILVMSGREHLDLPPGARFLAKPCSSRRLLAIDCSSGADTVAAHCYRRGAESPPP